MKLDSALTVVMFTLKLLGLFPHSWLVVFAPVLVYIALTVFVVVGKAVVEN